MIKFRPRFCRDVPITLFAKIPMKKSLMRHLCGPSLLFVQLAFGPTKSVVKT